MGSTLDFLILLIAAGLIIFAGGFSLALHWWSVARQHYDRRVGMEDAIVDAIVTSPTRGEAEHIAQKVRFTLGLEKVTAALQIREEIQRDGETPSPKKPGT